MKERMIHGVLVNPFDGTARELDADVSTLGKIHALLGCECFAIVARPLLGGKKRELDVWYDDEGLMKDSRTLKPSCVALSKETGKVIEQIVGKVFICSHDSKGEAKSLSKQDATDVLKLANDVTYTCDGTHGKALIYKW